MVKQTPSKTRKTPLKVTMLTSVALHVIDIRSIWETMHYGTSISTGSNVCLSDPLQGDAAFVYNLWC